MTQYNIAMVIIGVLVLSIGLVSKPLKNRLFMSEPICALGLGILFGPAFLGVVVPHRWHITHVIVEEVMRITLAVGLIGVALRIPPGYSAGHRRPLSIMLGGLMPLMWLSSGLMLWWWAALPFWGALMVGGVVTPTDPIVASSIVSGESSITHVPGRIRHLLSAESGFNDGLAYPFVYLGILMLQKPPGQAMVEWSLRVVAWEVCGAAIFGMLIGYVAGKILMFAERKDMIEYESFLAYSLSLSLVALGGGKLIGTDGILVVFVAGVVFSRTVKDVIRSQEERIQESINTFFTLPSFFLLGAVLPWGEWMQRGFVRMSAVAIALLVLRRLPFLFLLAPLLPSLKERRDQLFYGWFGPVGISALFYATFCFRKLEGRAMGRAAWEIGTMVIFWSILLHGITATPATKRLYAARSEEQAEEA